jgi:nucleoside-diphosphate-sugar epimerase
MRVFVTGATGFIGSLVVQELIGGGHKVLGLARSDAGAKTLTALGAEVLRGSLEDLEGLRKGAATSDAVIHLGFLHDFSKFAENCEVDRRAIEALGAGIGGSNKPLIVTDGAPVETEDEAVPADIPTPRVSENTALGLLSKRVRASVVRLPQVHDTKKQGLVSYLIAIAREKGVSAYVGDGSNRWPSVHVSDAARLYKLVLEKNEAGARYHAVAEEGVRLREIAETIGRGLDIPVRSISKEEAGTHFGWLGMFIARDRPVSSAITRKKLGWNPGGPGLIADLERMNYSQ